MAVWLSCDTRVIQHHTSHSCSLKGIADMSGDSRRKRVRLWYGEVDPDGRQVQIVARDGFFRIVAEVAPVAIQALGEIPFETYSRLNSSILLSWDDLNPEWYRYDPRLMPFGSTMTALRNSLLYWAQQWNLTADWCFDIALATLSWWHSYPNLRETNVITSRGGAYMGLRAEVEPPPGMPAFGAGGQTRAAYVDAVRERVSESLENDLLLSNAEPKLRKEFIDSIVKKAAAYCDEVKQYHLSTNPFCRDVPVKPEIGRHMRWAARVRVLCHSQEEIAEMFEAIADDEGLEVTAIKKAVKGIFDLVGLPRQPTFNASKGRPRTRRDSALSRRKTVGAARRN